MTDVVMPQMGESIVEGTLTKWLKKPGDKVERDEPLFEISTDKVDTEIPAPAPGTSHQAQGSHQRRISLCLALGVVQGCAPRHRPCPAPAQRFPRPTSPLFARS